MKSDILILGATGAIGYAVTDNLIHKGVPVTLLVRSREKAKKLFNKTAQLEIIEGDVQDLALLKRISADKKIIFHGVNYPYDKWFGNIDTATQKLIEAARQNQATIVYPGSVYNFGITQEHIREDSRPAPCSRKGQLRVELEVMMEKAAQEGKCKTIVVRLLDFWGPNVVNAGIEPIFLGALRKKPLPYLANADIPHQMVFTKDAAEVIVRLMQRDSTQPYEVFNYGGETMASMREFLGTVAETVNAPKKIQVHSRMIISILALFKPVIREVKEMLYLFENSIILDDHKIRKTFPDFQPTPLKEAITETREWFKINRLKATR